MPMHRPPPHPPLDMHFLPESMHGEKNVGILPADAPLTISPATTTLPEMFRRNGYQTAIVGKWHLGLGTKDIPVDFNREIKRRTIMQ